MNSTPRASTRADALLERRGNHVIVVMEDNGLGFDADVARFAQQGHLAWWGHKSEPRCLGVVRNRMLPWGRHNRRRGGSL